jgi:hypothetical protein
MMRWVTATYARMANMLMQMAVRSARNATLDIF